VSDSFDRRVLATYLEEYLGDFLFDTFQPFHFYTGRDGSSIDVPPAAPREVYIKAIEALPLVQSPEVREVYDGVCKHGALLTAFCKSFVQQ
jgi:dynein heavy chain